jgi:hypothetical protein
MKSNTWAKVPGRRKTSSPYGVRWELPEDPREEALPTRLAHMQSITETRLEYRAVSSHHDV